LFGEIVDGGMRLNDIGIIIFQTIEEIPKYYSNIEVDIFSVMPNHIHLIICIVGADPCVRPIKNGQTRGFAPTEKQLSLPQIIQRFKSLTTKKCIDGVKQNILIPFENRIWQRNYYEHIIRNEKSYDEIYSYIESNPSTWGRDMNNPKNIAKRA